MSFKANCSQRKSIIQYRTVYWSFSLQSLLSFFLSFQVVHSKFFRLHWWRCILGFATSWISVSTDFAIVILGIGCNIRFLRGTILHRRRWNFLNVFEAPTQERVCVFTYAAWFKEVSLHLFASIVVLRFRVTTPNVILNLRLVWDE